MPDSNTLKLKEIARKVLASEEASRKPANTNASPASRVCEKLRSHLSVLVGVSGYRALVSRALALAGTEAPWLRALHIRPDGSLEGLAELEAKLGAETIEQGEIALAARIIGLLATFIGPVLTLQILRDIWPKLKKDLDF